jgi:hypothetical protein
LTTSSKSPAMWPAWSKVRRTERWLPAHLPSASRNPRPAASERSRCRSAAGGVLKQPALDRRHPSKQRAFRATAGAP